MIDEKLQNPYNLNKKPLRSAIYCRVSKKGQELENQLRLLKEFNEKSGWILHDIYCDVVTGRDESRPEYDRLFKEAHQKLFDIALFWSLDRFARSGMTFTVIKLNELHCLGILYHSYQEPLINTDNELVRNIVIATMSSLAKIESEKISDRTKLAFCKGKDGKTIAHKSGKRVGRSAIPQKTIEEVKRRLAKKEPYSKIHAEVIYTTKFGKHHKISKGKISEIAQDMV